MDHQRNLSVVEEIQITILLDEGYSIYYVASVLRKKNHFILLYHNKDIQFKESMLSERMVNKRTVHSTQLEHVHMLFTHLSAYLIVTYITK